MGILFWSDFWRYASKFGYAYLEAHETCWDGPGNVRDDMVLAFSAMLLWADFSFSFSGGNDAILGVED